MLIPLFNFILIIELLQGSSVDNIREVIFNENNEWQQSINNTEQQIYIVKNISTKYCYVRIILSQIDPNFLLMSDYQQLPNNSQIQHYKQGEKIDRISQLEDRQTRFLKLKSGIGDIYILVRSNILNNQYVITISGSDQEQCDNDCSKNGICQVYGCSCNKSFIGNDCNQIAEELFDKTQKILTFPTSQQITFFYLDLQPLKKEQTLRLHFSFPEKYPEELNYFLEVRFYKSKAILKQLLNTMNDYVESFGIENKALTVTIRVPSNLTVQQQFLWFAIKKEQVTADSIQLQIDTYYDEFDYFFEEDDSDETNRLLYIIIPSVVGSIIILLLVIYYLRKRKNQAANYQIPKNKKEKQNINIEPEKCGICLEELSLQNKAVVKIQCNHQFHVSCIQDWGKKQINQQKNKQTNCPYCRNPFNPNEIQ